MIASGRQGLTNLPASWFNYIMNDAELAATAQDIRDTQIQELTETIDTLRFQAAHMPHSPNRAMIRKILAQMIVAKTALQQIPNETAMGEADLAIAASRS